MKKLIKVLFAVLLISNNVANAQYVVKGTDIVSVGIGIGSSLGGHSYSSQSPGLSFQYERGVWDIDGPGSITLGGYLGFKNYRYHENGYTENWNYTMIGFRGAYHYNNLKEANSKFLDKMDLYGGLMLSFNNLHYSSDFPNGYNHNNDYNSSLGASLFIGGRYFFDEHWAACVEIGYGISILNIGASYKF